jgi:hypothetical protein
LDFVQSRKRLIAGLKAVANTWAEKFPQTII